MTRTHEDPLAGDVDHFVHPDETRTDEQIAHDRKYAIEPYRYDAGEEYGAEMDAYLGLDGEGQEAQAAHTPEEAAEERLAYESLVKHFYRPINVASKEKARKEAEAKAEGAIDYNLDEKGEYGEVVDRSTAIQMALDKIAEDKRDDEEDRRLRPEYYEETEEDPLAGDVDRFVDPDETKD